MMDLTALQQYLLSLGSSFTLRSTDDKLQTEFQAFIATMPGKQINISPVSGGISLQNNVLTISSSTSDTWSVQGLTNVSLTLSSIIITINGAINPAVFTGVAQAQMPFSKTVNIPITITALSQTGNPWQVGLSKDAGNITPMEVILLGNNGSGLPFDIPSGMDFLSNALTVDKNDYSITFYPNSEEEAYIQFTLTAPDAVWAPVPDIFAFNGLDIIGSLKTNSVAVQLVGHILISSISIDAGIVMTMGTEWTVFTRPTPPAETFPGLADLANWIGGAVLGTSVSKGFTNVQISTTGFDAAIADITAGIDISEFSLKYLNIKSLLSIGALMLDVTVQLPSLYIKGGLHNNKGLKITDLLTSLSLPSGTVPDNLTLAKANFTADLSNSVYTIDTEVDNLWTAGPLSFDMVTLSLGYNAVDKLTGTFGCQFTIGDTATILLLAEYAGATTGWTFSGGLDPTTTLRMGDVITLLLNQFGITSVPEPVKSLVITELWVSYAAATSAFEFKSVGNFTVDDTEVDMTVVVKLEQGPGNAPVQDGQVNGTKGYNAFFSGKITINNLVFDIVFDTSSTSTNVFIATYHNTGTGNTSLHDLVAGVSTSLAQFIPAGLLIDLKEVKFIFFEQNSVKQFLFGLEMDVEINLSELPVIGEKLPSDLTLDIENLQVLFSSAVFTREQIAIINPLLPSGIVPLTVAGLAKGLIISGDLIIAGYHLPINTGTKPATSTTQFTGTASVPTTGTAPVAPSPITWFNVNKQLGPLKFERIGIEYVDNVLSFALDASLTMGPANLSMMGLSFGSTLSKFSPVFGLQGFSMDIKTSGFEVGGAFLKALAPDGATAYYGEVIAKIGTINIKALGGDTPEHESDDPNNPGKKIKIPASFFLYACINAPLGGPPFLYLNGFAGGFGVNNLLKLPTLENLPGYILLPGSASKAPAQGSSGVDTINTVLPQMQQYFVSEPGQYWMAAGIAFSSFQMINAFALVTVSFGVDFQVALLGSCSMNFPTGAPTPIAFVEIDILASFSPKTGLLAVEGILSPSSYVFGSFCKITGGFAFYIWFNPPKTTNGPKAGDFVVTLGGYHPAFTPPAYYPKVPRLGINFNLGPFHVTGGCYFALTPGMFMAGGSLNATWNLDIIKAWFTIGADFLIAWAPFHYEAEVYVSIGCSVNLGLFTLNISVGADLLLWGPPFGGIAEVDLDVISFTISFGSAQELPSPIGWNNFKKMFLPGDTSTSSTSHNLALMAITVTAKDSVSTNILKLTIESGLQASDVNGFDWILDPNHFIISISTTVPVNAPVWATGAETFKILSNTPADYNILPPPVDSAKWPYLVFNDIDNKMDVSHIWNPTVNIKPMNLNNISSGLNIRVLKMDDVGNNLDFVTALTVTPVVLDSSAALWDTATGNKPNANDPSFLKACLTGFRITPLPRIPNVVNGVLLIQLLYQQGNNYYFNYQIQTVGTDCQVSSTGEDTDDLIIQVSGMHTASLSNTGYVLSSLKDTWVGSQRSAILQNLKELGFDTYSAVNLTTFASQTALTDWPEVMQLGDNFAE